MANVQKYFEQFHKNIRMDYDWNQELREKRDIILELIQKSLKEQKHPGFERLLQGGYAMKTGVKPIGKVEHDIDVGLLFRVKADEYSATTVRGWVHDAVKDHTNDVDEKPNCIRVRYEAGYHVDLVVYAIWDDDQGSPQIRLAHKSNGWRPSDPKRLIDIVIEAMAPFDGTEDNATKTNQFRRSIRYMKRWYDEFIPKDSRDKPSGIAYSLFARLHLTPHATWDGKPDDLAALESLASGAAATSGRIIVTKPTPEGEDVFGKLSETAMTELKKQFVVMAKALAAARTETDPVVACKVLQKVFGRDFPVPEPEDTGKKTAAPAILTTSSSA